MKTSTLILPDSGIMPRKRWTREECRQLMTLGMLEQGKYELIEGEIVVKMGQNGPHVFVCLQVFRLLVGIFGFDHVRFPAPVVIDETNEPEPDVAVTTGTTRDYIGDNPASRDIRLAVEVSDSTIQSDKRIKATLYARAGIAEYWIVNINARELIVHRAPTENGYAEVEIRLEHETVQPLAAPGTEIRVSTFLP